MADQQEVLKYNLDIADVEAKVKRLNELLGQIKAGQAAGQDTAALEVALRKEADGLDQVTQKQQQGKTTADELIKSKEKLASVVGLLGGSFGGVVGQIANVLELFTRMPVAIAGVGAALATATAAFQVYEQWREQVRALIAEQERLNEVIAEQNRIQGERRSSIAETLRDAGALTPQTEDQAVAIAQNLRKDFGFSQQRADAAAAQAVLTGRGTTEQAAVIAQLQKQLGGLAPAEADKKLREIEADPARMETIWRAIEQARAAPESQRQMARAEGLMTTGRAAANERAFEVAQQMGALPASVKTVEDFRRLLEVEEATRGKLKTTESELRGFTPEELITFRRSAAPVESVVRREQQRERVGAFDVTPRANEPQAAPVGNQTYISVVGTVFNTPERKVSGPTRTMGLGVSQAIDNKRGLD